MRNSDNAPNANVECIHIKSPMQAAIISLEDIHSKGIRHNGFSFRHTRKRFK